MSSPRPTAQAGNESGPSDLILGAHVGRMTEWVVGVGMSAFYFATLGFTAVLWTSQFMKLTLAPLLAFSAGPVVILALTRITVWILGKRRTFPWLSSTSGEAPPPEVEGWHMSRDLGLAVVSLRTGVTVWLDARAVAPAPLPSWLDGASQWGKIRFRGRFMPVGLEWAAPATSGLFMLAVWGMTRIQAVNDYYMPLFLFMFVGPIVAILAYVGVAVALLWHPSMELEGNTARVLLRGQVEVSLLRAVTRGPISGCAQLMITEAQPRWPALMSWRLFRPIAMFTREVRQKLGFNEAEVIRRIIEERARPQGSVYRAIAPGSQHESVNRAQV